MRVMEEWRSLEVSHNKSDIPNMIIENYKQLERSIATQLEMQSQHPGTVGGFREEIWRSLFAQIVPKKFSIARSVFIIDSEGQTSHEVDLAIFDEQYTPYIFNYGELKYIPIEAVAAVIQCKSKTIDDDIDGWVDSITKLKTSLRSIARMHVDIADGEYSFSKNEDGEFEIPPGSKNNNGLYQTSTRPVLILCHMNKSLTERNQVSELFDIFIRPIGDRLDVRFFQDRAKGEPTLNDWYNRLNHHQPCYTNIRGKWDRDPSRYTLDQYKVYDQIEGKQEEVALLSLIFQLNQLLMLINNPLLFPHLAYVDMFNKRAISANSK